MQDKRGERRWSIGHLPGSLVGVSGNWNKKDDASKRDRIPGKKGREKKRGSEVIVTANGT